jgi:eukaryotic-like serine/threonine-protein kinase
MERGTVLAGRFRIEGRHAAGGMGEIHLATDLETSTRVALKVMRWQDYTIEARFAREAALLAELSHPNIVRYVAHGRSPEGEAYLAMEWIDGMTLLERLREGPLSVSETLALARCVAEALAVAHARSIVHRDLKPANLFCERGEVSRTKVLDFGLARNAAASLMMLTHPGELAGTPGYMAPEQARGLHEVDARADIYSLGCVLYECLTGRPPFSGGHVFAVLAKILVEDTPRVRELRPDVPPALDALLARMMAKDVKDRPADASELLQELRRVSSADDETAPPLPRASLGRGEQRVVCVVLAAGTLAPAQPDSAPTISEQEPPAADAGVASMVKSYGGSLDYLAGGALLVLITGAGSATDLATRAARCALALSTLVPDKQIAITTGRGAADGRLPAGAAIDEAARLLAQHALAGKSEPSASSVPATSVSAGGLVRLDEVTANLLDPRFEIGVSDGQTLLLGFTEYREAERTLLGKPTAFVGRERELANLLGCFDECWNEPLAQAVLVTGPAGSGKSRLRQEFLRRMSPDAGPVQVWVGRGDPMSAGAPLAMLAQMIRREAGFTQGESLRRCRRKLRARITRDVPASEVERVVVFLGEMCGVSFDDAEQPLLRTARGDAGVMGDQMRRAWEDFLAAACQHGPLVLVLEDLHWGDLPTVKFIDAALRSLAARPILVLALARPDVHELFPDLWKGRAHQVLSLRPLGERAARKLVEQSLAGRASDSMVTRIVAEAAGNAFYLEELIRAAAGGQESPGTVLAMIGARLEGLMGEQRRLLRAASILGGSFWPDALAALTGSEPGWLERALDQLVDSEWLTCRPESTRAAQREYAFRHALVREAAYAMLTDEDRQLGHRISAEWLATHGATDAATIGEHLERGGAAGLAISWYVRAARQALEGTDIRAAVVRARRGLECAAAAPEAASTQDIGQLRTTLAEAYTWLGDNPEAEADGVAALEILPRYSLPWYAAVSQVALAAGRLNHGERVVALAQQLCAAEVDAAHAAAWMHAALPEVQMLNWLGGQHELIDALLERADRLMPVAETADPSLPGHLALVVGSVLGARGDAAAGMANASRAADLLEQVGHRRRAAVARHDVASDLMELGAWARAERELRKVLAEAEELGMTRLDAVARMNLGMCVAMQGRYEEGEQLERGVLANHLATRPDARLEVGLREYLGNILLAAGNAAGAEAELARGRALVQADSAQHVHILGVLAAAVLAQGRVEEARALAGRAMDMIARLGEVENDGLARLIWAEALAACGDMEGARAAIAQTRARVDALASHISDAELRESFLTAIPHVARTRARAREWLGEP